MDFTDTDLLDVIHSWGWELLCDDHDDGDDDDASDDDDEDASSTDEMST